LPWLVQAEQAQVAGSQSLCIFYIKESLLKAQKWREKSRVSTLPGTALTTEPSHTFLVWLLSNKAHLKGDFLLLDKKTAKNPKKGFSQAVWLSICIQTLA